MTDIIFIDERTAEDDERAETLNWQVEDLFEHGGINIADYEEPLFGIADGDDLIAALVAGAPHEDPWVCMRFSLVVHSDHRRKGLGSKLVEAFVAYCADEGYPPEAHVVNDEAMVPMLEGFGFSNDGPIWTY